MLKNQIPVKSHPLYGYLDSDWSIRAEMAKNFYVPEKNQIFGRKLFYSEFYAASCGDNRFYV